MKYIWQSEKFPLFTFQKDKIHPLVEKFALELGEANGMISSFHEDMKLEVFTEIMLSEALKTSEIEGEFFSREEVMSSLKVNLGLIDFHQNTKNKKANAIAALMIEIQKKDANPFSEKQILHWHQILMGNEKRINAGQFRTGQEPMQVVSDPIGNFTIHYEAPPSKDLPYLIPQFLEWYHRFSEKDWGRIGEAMLFAALTHLYFETLHPFEDGNGRIGRALAEKALAEKLETPIFISISKAIEKDKNRYYSELKKAQRNLQITDWIMYFFEVLQNALTDTKKVVLFTLKKTNFFDRFKEQFNERQLKAIHKMMAEGESGFKGGMTAKKYIAINKTSKASATRDLQHLAEIRAFIPTGAGRSVSYHLNLEG